MTYQKQNFQDGRVLSASQLNTIEQGIVDNENAIAQKQDKGDYITAETFNAGIANKQDKGDYVTKTEANNTYASKENTYTKTEVDNKIANSGGGGGSSVDLGEYLKKTEASQAYQEKLVSGANIKTINGQSLLGSGNIEVEGGSGGTVTVVTKRQSALLFDVNFKKTASITSGLFSSGFVSSSLSDKGYLLPTGIGNQLVLNKNIDIDDIKIVATVELSALDCVVLMGAKSTNSTLYGSVIQFDFANQVIKIGERNAGTSLPTSYVKTYPIGIIDGLKYQLEVGRKARKVYAAVVNYKTGLRTEVIVEELASDNYAFSAGMLYDNPTIALVSGSSVYMQRWACAIPTNVNVAILGDSITQGHGVAYNETWAYMSGQYFGNCALMGRSAGTIDQTLSQVKDILPVMKPKYAMVTIGTNGGNTASKLSEVVKGIEAVGAVPIINHIYMNNRANGDWYPSTANALIDSLKVLTVNMDIATAVNNEPQKGLNTVLFQSDKLHLNAAGHFACYERVLADLGFLGIDSVYEESEQSGYTITYVTNGYGTKPATVYGATAIPNELPTLEASGYEFGGWYTDSALTVVAVPGSALTANVVLYAKWTANSSPAVTTWYVEHSKVNLDSTSTVSSATSAQFRDFAPGDIAQAKLYGKKINRIGMHPTSTGTCVWYYTESLDTVGHEVARFTVSSDKVGAYNFFEVEEFTMPSSGWLYLSHHPATDTSNLDLICSFKYSAKASSLDGGFYGRVGGSDYIHINTSCLCISFGYVAE